MQTSTKQGPASADHAQRKYCYRVDIEDQYTRLTKLLDEKGAGRITIKGLIIEEENELLTTRDMKRAAELVLKGLANLDH